MERHITHNTFQSLVRPKLRFGHEFEHHELERTHELFTKGLEHMGEKKLTANNYKKFVKFIKEESEGRRLAEQFSAQDLERIHSTLKNHLGISDATPE